MVRTLLATAAVLVVSYSQVQAQAPRTPVSAKPVSARQAEPQPLFRHASVNEAWAAVQQSRKPMFLYVTSDNCYFCKKMIQETYTNPQIRSGVSAYSEPVAFNASETPELAKKLGVRAFPTTLVISPENKLLHKIEGFVEPKDFAEQVWPVLQQAELERREVLQAAAARRRQAEMQSQRIGLRNMHEAPADQNMVTIQD
ncbi:thioredoxin family protein [Aeoliella mucimassa]|uniref:Thiol:disulfide interchange protein n=1 Tax=Aeoliella mucimassa TaxID=2527972 RepID=A0A518AHN1_9BACT|nr:thioredoxin family protein [Aeoliella mucimassa]QDU54220.1 thiol:disulfide interchange protein precursor [Aeoliella mucimassa]